MTVLFLYCVGTLSSQDVVPGGDTEVLGDDCYQLTDALNNQVGTIFSNDMIDLSEDFNFEFVVNFGFSDGGADGMVFVLQNFGTDFIGTSGGGIGYENAQSMESIAIEFDTWQNAERGDPFFDHTAVISNSSTDHVLASGLTAPVQLSSTNTNVEDGLDHLLKITWESATQLLLVEFDCVERISFNYDIAQNIFGGDNMVHWGFTSSTGGANNAQSICIAQELEAVFPEECVDEGEFVLTAPGLNTHIFSWTPDVVSISSNNQTVIVQIDETTTFQYTSTDPCDGTTAIGSITIFVNTLEIGVTSDVIDCYSDSIKLFGMVNQNSDIIFDWTSDTGVILLGGDSINAIGSGIGTYIFSVTDTISNCARSLAYEAPTDFVEPFITSSVDGLLSCLTPLVQLEIMELSGLSNIQYVWSTNEGNIVSTDENIATVDLAGLYEGVVINLDNGCSDTLDVLAQNDPAFAFSYEAVNVPNVISPNADFVNDDFKAFLMTDPEFELIGKFGAFELNVFNRWGNEVFSSDNIEEVWNADDESTGVYFYVFQYSDLCDLEDVFVKKGTVEILK